MNTEKIEEYVLVVDVGNTVTRLGLVLDGAIEETWTISTKKEVTVDEVRLSLMQLPFYLQKMSLSEQQASPGVAFSKSILSCVVPDLTDIWVAALQSEGKRPPLVVGPGLKTGMKMNYNDPSEIGPDRIADMVAAKATYECPLIVIDFGTITSFQVIDQEGTFLGGIIAPGLELSAKTLPQVAARLPIIELRMPASLIGKTTREAMQSGVLLGEIARIDGLIGMIWKDLGYETEIVLTGKDAELMSSLLSHETHPDPTLTLRGLSLLYDKNR